MHISKQPALDHPFLKNHTIQVALSAAPLLFPISFCSSASTPHITTAALKHALSSHHLCRCGLHTTRKVCMMSPRLRRSRMPKQSPKCGIRMAGAPRTRYRSGGPRRRTSWGPAPSGGMARRRAGVPRTPCRLTLTCSTRAATRLVQIVSSKNLNTSTDYLVPEL